MSFASTTRGDRPKPPPRADLKAHEIWVRLLLYPTHTFPTAAAPVFVGLGFAWRDGVLAPLPLAIGFLASWLIHVGGVFHDNHELLRRHPELPEHPELLQALADGSLSLAGLRQATLACFVLALATAPYLIGLGGPLAFAFGLVGMTAALGYAGGSLPYTRLGLADPVFLAMFGFVAPVGAYYVQWAALHPAASHGLDALAQLPLAALFAAGLPVGALVTNVMVIDDIRDRRFDAAKGWRTMATRYGLAGARRWYLGLTVLAYAMPPALWLAPGGNAWRLLPLATLPLAVTVARAVRTRSETHELIMMSPRASFLAAAYGLLAGIAVALG